MDVFTKKMIIVWSLNERKRKIFTAFQFKLYFSAINLNWRRFQENMLKVNDLKSF